MALVLLDTDILSELLKQKDLNVVRHAANYFNLHGQFALSALTRYEAIVFGTTAAQGPRRPAIEFEVDGFGCRGDFYQEANELPRLLSAGNAVGRVMTVVLRWKANRR